MGALHAPAQSERWQDYYERYIVDHLEIGLRVSPYKFKEDTKHTYDSSGNWVGGYTKGISTYKMEEEQSYVPTPYIRYNFIEYVGLELSWMRLEGKTVTYWDQYTDGSLLLSGPSAMVYGRYPTGRFAPYAGIGMVWFSADFQMDPSWHADGLRNMVSEDCIGLQLTAGTSVEIYKHIEADIALSSVNAESSTRYWMRGDSRDRATWDYPVAAWVLQLGLKYAF